MSGHTPGPWETRWPKFDCVIVGQQDLSLARVYFDGRNDAEAEANANLIAAAPDLLEALKGLYELVPDCDGDYLLDGNKGEFALKAIRVPGIGDACRQARAAIAKAEGRS
jgi:hypothetical protein